MADNTQTKWYQFSIEEAFKALETKDSGFTSQEVKERLEKSGGLIWMVGLPSCEVCRMAVFVKGDGR